MMYRATYSLFALGLGLLSAQPGLSQDQTIITAHGISPFGDLALPADFAHLPYVNPQAPKGGEMAQWAPGGFDSMNPYSVKGRAAALSSLPYESILTGTLDEIGASYCLICSTMEYPQDRSWVIFNLREGVTFSDGSPLTAEDVAFSFETFRTKGLTDFRTVFNEQVQGVEVLSPLKVKFTFKPEVPTRDLPADVGAIPVFSKAHYEANKLNLEESSLTPFLGSGPYVPDVIKPGQTITYKRNPDYWGKDLPINIGTNNFDTIRVEYFADSNAAFEGFKAGAYTFRSENSSKQWATGYDFPALQKGFVVKAEIPNGNKANGQGFFFNLRRDKFQDIRVRQAIGLMFNFEWSNQTLFYGLYARINSVWENSWLAAVDLPSPEEAALLQPLVDEGLLDASILTEGPVMAPVSGSAQLDRKALRAASALMDEAGWAVGEDGLRRNAKGEVFALEFLTADANFERVLSPYAENLKALGIEAKVSLVDSAQYSDRLDPPKFDFDVITSNASASYIPGSEIKQSYGSETANNSSYNIMGLQSKAVDRLIPALMAAKTAEELAIATRAMDRVLRAERFWVPQWYKDKYTVAYYDQYGAPQTPPRYGLGELETWWFDQAKADRLKAEGALK